METAKMNRKWIILISLIFSLLIPGVGYYYLGPFIAGLFLVGYLGGFFMWLATESSATWPHFRTPYLVCLGIYIFLHKVEENRMKLFETLGEKITGIPVPQVTPFLIFGLLILPIGSWLLVPILVKRSHPIGYYLAWTYFASFGLVELAHFVFPVLTAEPYGYFPGMASAVILAPAGWWGMWRLYHSDRLPPQST